MGTCKCSFQVDEKVAMSLGDLGHFTTDNSCQITGVEERSVGVKKKHLERFQ